MLPGNGEEFESELAPVASGGDLAQSYEDDLYTIMMFAFNQVKPRTQP